MAWASVRRFGIVLLSVGLPLAMIGLALAITSWVAIQDILSDEDPDEGTKSRAESSFYIATAGTFMLSAGLVATTVGGVLLSMTGEDPGTRRGIRG